MGEDVAVTDDLDDHDHRVADGAGDGVGDRGRFAVGSLHPRTALLLASAFATVTLVAVMALIPVPYAVLAAGPATNTLGTVDGTPGGKPLIVVTGRATYPTTGALDLTTVRIFGGPGSSVSLWQALRGWLDPGVAVVPQEAIFPPGQTAQQSQQENAQEMASSQESATAAALRTLGIAVTEDVRIEAFSPNASSASSLKVKDILVSVGGVRITSGEVLREQIRKVAPGSSVEVTVRRSGKETTVRALTRAGGDGTTVLGITIGSVFTFPFEVKIQIDNVGGPSAGTMFALGIIDKLTPGAMTGGQKIAGTGTIDPDGVVGPIGGIRQKLIGARDQGARFFLAPAEDCPEVVGHVPDGMSVVKIQTLAQARTAVEQIGAGKGVGGLASCG